MIHGCRSIASSVWHWRLQYSTWWITRTIIIIRGTPSWVITRPRVIAWSGVITRPMPPSKIGIVVTWPVTKNHPITNTESSIKFWLWYRRIIVHFPTMSSLKRPTMEEGWVRPPSWALKICIHFNNWLGNGRWGIATTTSTSSWEIVKSLSNEWQPFLGRTIVFCPQNITSVKRNYLLKSEKTKWKYDVESETTNPHMLVQKLWT